MGIKPKVAEANFKCSAKNHPNVHKCKQTSAPSRTAMIRGVVMIYTLNMYREVDKTIPSTIKKKESQASKWIRSN